VVAYDTWHDPFWTVYERYRETLHKLETEPVSGRGGVEAEQVAQVKQLLQLGVDVAGELVLPASGKKLATTMVDRGMDAAVAALSLKDQIVQLVQQHRVTKRDRALQELLLNPLPQLTQAWVEGLSQQAKQRPLVLIFDTYEKVTLNIDTWLWRSVLGNTSLTQQPVRLVVAGRHCLLKTEGWRKLQQDRHCLYEQTIERFDEAQTQDYLQQIGITEATAIHSIFRVTKGLPYYLNWIREERDKGRSLDFSQGNEAIVNLLLQGLNPSQKRLVQLAACYRGFDPALIRQLTEQQALDFATAVDASLNCFDWLTQQTFVQLVQGRWRLDDVARDVFRLSLWQDDQERFAQVQAELAQRFFSRSDQEVPPDQPPSFRYNNPDWRAARADALYHLLLSRDPDRQHRFLSHLLEARYFKQDEVVRIPFNALIAERELTDHPLLSASIRQWLSQIQPAIVYGWAVLEKDPIDYPYNQEKYGLSQSATDQAIQRCLGQPNRLEGLAKFMALFCKAKRCPDSQRYDGLLKAKAQAEQLIAAADPDFSSGLFLWRLGSALYDLECYEEAIASYDQAIAIQPDYPDAWNNRGLALSALGQQPEAIASYDQAIKIKPDDYRAWDNRGDVFKDLKQYEAAIESYDRAIAINSEYRYPWSSRAVALMKLGRYEEAHQSFDRALNLKPDWAGALYDKACCYGLQAEVALALEHLQQAIELDPQSRQMAQTDAAFDPIRADPRFQAVLHGDG
jgi:tetratricopeptide (TPR) repeat protein